MGMGVPCYRPRPPVSSILVPFRHLGIFLCAGIATLVLGLVVHHSSNLPSSYSWTAAVTTLRAIVALPNIPLIAFFVFCIGRFAHRGAWDPYALGKRLTSQMSFDGSQKRGLLLQGLAAVVAMTLDTIAFETHTITDVMVVGIAGSQLPKVLRSPRVVAEFALQGAIAVFVFTVLCYTFTVIKALLFKGTFPHDGLIIDFESSIFGEPIHRMIAAWAAESPKLVWWMDWVYNRFFHHMILTSVLLFALRRAREQNEYLAALLFCYLAGGPLYHLLPAAGPVFFEPQQYEYLRQQPELVTNFLQFWLYRQTALVNDGLAKELLTWTYVAAMPSLHMAHEVVMTWYSRRSRIAFAFSLAFTLATLLSIMVLGWHYFTDALAGTLLAVTAILIARKLPNAFMPSFVKVAADVPMPKPRPVLRPFFEGVRDGMAAPRERVPAAD